MIIPCINSTSACDRGGRVAFVDGGRVLLGLPGAPGCTTTGGSVCRARAAAQVKPVGTLATSSMPHNNAGPVTEWSIRLRRKWESFHFDAQLIIIQCSHAN